MTKFGRIWPGKWQDMTQQAGGIDAISSEWRDGLEGMTGEQIKRAIEKARQGCAWPPSISQFRELGMGQDVMTTEQAAFSARVEASDSLSQALPAETWAETRVRGAKALQGLREALAKRGEA